MTNATIKNARIEGKPRVINPIANTLEVTVAYESVNGKKQQKRTDFLVRLTLPFDPATESYIIPQGQKPIYNTVASAIPMTGINGERDALSDVVLKYFKEKYESQNQQNEK